MFLKAAVDVAVFVGIASSVVFEILFFQIERLVFAQFGLGFSRRGWISVGDLLDDLFVVGDVAADHLGAGGFLRVSDEGVALPPVEYRPHVHLVRHLPELLKERVDCLGVDGNVFGVSLTVGFEVAQFTFEIFEGKVHQVPLRLLCILILLRLLFLLLLEPFFDTPRVEHSIPCDNILGFCSTLDIGSNGGVARPGVKNFLRDSLGLFESLLISVDVLGLVACSTHSRFNSMLIGNLIIRLEATCLGKLRGRESSLLRFSGPLAINISVWGRLHVCPVLDVER